MPEKSKSENLSENSGQSAATSGLARSGSGAVEIGTPLLMLSQSDEIRVVANFKETQLDLMRVGQPVDIEVDAYPNQEFHGHIDSFQLGTGSRFSVLPAENNGFVWFGRCRRADYRSDFGRLDYR